MAIYIHSNQITRSQIQNSTDRILKHIFQRQKHHLNYVDHGVSPEISYDCSTGRITINSSYDCSTGQITINSSDNSIDLSVIGYTPPEEPKEYIYGRYLEAVTDYKTMTIISKNKEGNRAKSGSKTYTYNKHNWNNWKQATQQEQS